MCFERGNSVLRLTIGNYESRIQGCPLSSQKVFSGLAVTCLLLLISCGGGSSSSNGASGSGATPPPAGSASLGSINHIILFMQENRSFDHYFGQINVYRAANGLSADLDTWSADKTPANVSNVGYDPVTGQPGPPIPAFHMQSACSENLSSAWDESHRALNLNDRVLTNPPDLMNGFAFVEGHFAADSAAFGFGTFLDVNGKRAMGYYDSNDLPYYYFMASNFATSDRWFSPVPTRTHPNRLYWMAATSQGWIVPPTLQIPAKPIFALLDAKNISWKIYLGGNNTYYSYFTYSINRKQNVVPLSEYFNDLKNGTLPQVAYIETGVENNFVSSSGVDEHPDNNVQTGAQFAASLINPLMESSSWKDSVFIETYDEGGGFFDHVPPMPEVNPDGIAPMLAPTNAPGENFTKSGFRVPMFVVSPYAKKNYVSHTPMDFTAALKLIETRFGLPNLTERDKAMPDMTEFFDFSTPKGPWAVPPKPPPQPKNLPCTQGVPAG